MVRITRPPKPAACLKDTVPVSHLHLRVADLADAVHDPLVRPGESPGVERPSRVVEVVDVPGGDARRGRTVLRGEGDLILDQDAAPGKESLRDAETELGIAPGKGNPFAVRHDGGEDLPPTALLRQIDPRVPRRSDPRQQPKGEDGSRDSGDDRSPAAQSPLPKTRLRPYFSAPFSVKNFRAPGWRYFSASGVTRPTAFCGVSAAAPFQTAVSSGLLSKIAFRIW